MPQQLIAAFASNEDVFIGPFLRDFYILVPTVLWWIFFHVAMNYIVPRVVPFFHRLKPSEKEEFVIRVVSAANGMMLSTCSPVFVRNFLANGILGGSLYTELPEYRIYRAAIVGYFVWDVITCFYYRWGIEWKIHGVCSLLGSYFLMYPLMDDLGSYYGGLFEGTNAFLHVSAMLRMISAVCNDKIKREREVKERANGIATVLEYMFAFLFTMLRVVMGSLVGYCSVSRLCRALYADYVSPKPTPPQSHNALVVLICLVSVSSIHILQYIWFVLIIKKALGLDASPAEEPRSDKVVEKKEK